MASFINELIKAINNSNKIAIFSHENSDHDSLCSSCALHLILQKLGKHSDIFVEEKPSNAILHFVNSFELKTEINESDKYDLAIVCDTGEAKRIGEKCLSLFNTIPLTFCIDHHHTNKGYAKYNYIKECSSTCEILYNLFHNKVDFDAQIAKLLYTGIYMDCGAFTYSNANYKTYKCASELLKLAPNSNDEFFVAFGIAHTENFEITKLAMDSVKFYLKNQLAISVLTNEDFKKANCPKTDAKFIVSYMQGIKGVKISANFRQGKNVNDWFISLRTSYDDIDVSKIAQKFNGGGHKRASGLTLKGDINKVINALVYECKKVLK